MIHLEDVHLTLESAAGSVNILRGVDFRVAPGETLGLVGPSGSGKSTLLAVIAGLEQATSGSVEVAGTNLSGLDEDALALFRRDHIGIVFQAFHLITTMTALENVAVPLEFAGRDDAFARAAEDLATVGLEERLHHYPAQLSGGEQQRVAVARAFAPTPKLLLADEPTGNLDGETGGAIIELLFSIHEARGTTLVLITHDAELAGRCDRIAHMKDGRIDGADPGAAAFALSGA
ncbi:MAG: ABC transporter ATP-binding protein [Alphaproteobacteria bacterium]|nr:ABC transporter ATP-binding protein [Alphaproteobacteria bacterium]